MEIQTFANHLPASSPCSVTEAHFLHHSYLIYHSPGASLYSFNEALKLQSTIFYRPKAADSSTDFCFELELLRYDAATHGSALSAKLSLPRCLLLCRINSHLSLVAFIYFPVFFAHEFMCGKVSVFPECGCHAGPCTSTVEMVPSLHSYSSSFVPAFVSC